VLFPPAIFITIEIVAVVTTVAAIWWGLSRRWSIEPAVAMILLVSSFHLASMVGSGTIDRYALPAAAPLVPLLAAVSTTIGRQGWARGWAIACLLIRTGIYVVGQQDYEAWQDARDKTARIAYQKASPDQVDAGWDANNAYLYLPAYEQGKLFDVRDIDAAPYRLVFANFSDTRPGASYKSLAPGRIVIAGPSTP